MNAIVPLNIAALRVNQNDFSKVTGNFQGRTAVFEQMPWYDGKDTYKNKASTGDKIFHPLGVASGGQPVYGPASQLNPGIHLHWELPDFFRKGSQVAQGAKIEFPHAPNRWLVTRYLSIFDTAKNAYGPITSYSWIVESDYIYDKRPDNGRPIIPVPLPVTPQFKEQPYKFMGRVVDLKDWNPAGESPGNYLPHYNGTDGQPLYLTSVGFVGAYFGSYYPECCSVFGFWDNFADNQDVQNKINNNIPIQFRATYQVTGWINEATQDPLAGIVSRVTKQYEDYVKKCLGNNAKPQMGPIDFFNQIASQKMKWDFNQADLSATVDDNYHITSMNVPTQTICAGMMQEVVWNMLTGTGTTYFLQSNNSDNVSAWQAQTEIAVGNSTEEALAALLRHDMNGGTDDPDVLSNYEFLLDALQLGLLANLEKTPNKLVSLEEGLHTNGFSALAGGYTWLIASENEEDDGNTEKQEVNLPLDLAEKLSALNQAQKNYDMRRGGLSIMRKQLFMDWVRYIKINIKETTDPNVTAAAIKSFIYTSSGGELNAVLNEQAAAGILAYDTDPVSGAITGIKKPDSSVLVSSNAYVAWQNFDTVKKAVDDFNTKNPSAKFILASSPAPNFFMPSEPVVLMEGDMMEPSKRNGDRSILFVRQSPDILSQLTVTYSSTNFTINVAALQGVPAVSANMPAQLQADVQSLTGEGFLLAPMLATAITAALAAQGGNNNPAVASPGDFTTSLMYAQGGLSPLDIVPAAGGIPTPPADSLYALISSSLYLPAENPTIKVDGPQNLQVIFTNAAGHGWPLNSIAWNTQELHKELSASRMDPFLPIFMIWSISLNPLLWEQDKVNQVYAPNNVTDFFELDKDGVDYLYKMNNGAPVPFTSALAVPYGDASTMRTGSTGVLSFQISTYVNDHPTDPENDILNKIAAMYKTRKILSQSLGGFNIQQVLSTYVAQVAVENLVQGAQDNITGKVADAARANANDNWYNDGFTSLEPIAGGLQAQGNFGPLRAGFMEITSIEVVDAFGQRMDLYTKEQTPDGSLACITSYAMSPRKDDTVNKGKIYLAPRIGTPARMWFHWLSAEHNSAISTDFVEMNTHPATSPICGWVLPNHLDNNLFFYDANGNAIGTFGIEQESTHPKLVYRTRAGNFDNRGNDLWKDIGREGEPTRNEHLANFMWYIAKQDGKFLKDMMMSIQNSDVFINPANFAQDASLSVFIGRPLALTRVVTGIETIGNLLPLSQADNGPSSPFPQDVNNQRVKYTDRMPYSSANLGNVKFPMRLGDLVNMDDGLVGFLMESNSANPYTGQVFYAPAADKGLTGLVQRPADTTLQYTLNAGPVPLTLLVDPRAPVHATTGVLAVSEISIPPDQYSDVVSSLAVNFVTRPMLQPAQGLVVPLPAEQGYDWSWITPGVDEKTSLKANDVTQTPAYGYTPQTLQEGWLELLPIPPSGQ